MKIVILNGKRMTDKDAAHKYLKRKLRLPNYYGENLDALWDILSTMSEKVEIKFINSEIFLDKLGQYGESIIETFSDAANENGNIYFELVY